MEQLRFESGNVPPSVAAWPGGRFILTSHGGLIGRWDAPSARSPGQRLGHATADGALYVEVVRDGVPVFEHHAGDELERVTPVGPRPPESRNTFAGVAPSGAFTVALDEPRRAALKREFRARLGAGDDPFELSARAWIATGRV